MKNKPDKDIKEIRMELNKACKQKHIEGIQAQHLLDTTRAGKLLKKGTPFIVVSINEPYYPQVYRLIRQHELRKGTWTENCEKDFQGFIESWFYSA